MILFDKIKRRLLFLSDWRAWPFFFQRGVSNPASRRMVAAWLAKRCPLPQHQSALDSSLARGLDQRGIAHFGQLLSKEQVTEIKAWLEQRPVVDGYRPEVSPFLPHSEDRHPHSHVAYHDAKDVIAAPHLLELANRPEILAVVEDFLGCKPLIGYLAAWWSYATEIGPQQAENFHRDVDDWRFVKLFVFLTDVGDNNGPHIYVSGSADCNLLTKIRRYGDGEIIAAFGAGSIIVNQGAAGTGFLENTSGFHKGKPVQNGTRLMFQAVYSLCELPYGPKKPVVSLADLQSKTKAVLDPFSNRVYVRP
jgi:hypothetical protein